MRAVAAPESGLRGERRLTHAYFVDVPDFARPFVLSDAVLNIAPNLAAKRDIVQNAIDARAGARAWLRRRWRCCRRSRA